MPAESSARWLDFLPAFGLLAAICIVFGFDRRTGGSDPGRDVPPPPPPVVIDEEIPPLDSDFLTKIDTDDTPPPEPPPLPAPKKVVIDSTKLLSFGFDGNRSLGLRTLRDKRLTFNEYGMTNHTMVSVDGDTESFFGRRGEVKRNLQFQGKGTGISSDKPGKAGDIEVNRLSPNGPYIVAWEYNGILVEQWVDFEGNESSGKTDRMRVRFTLENKAATDRKAGLRVMIDTLIGGNDGVPFFVPGRADTVTKQLVLKDGEVPEYLLALERPDLTDTNMTIVEVTFGVDREEKPGEIRLCKWPGIPQGEGSAPRSWVDGLKWDYPIEDFSWEKKGDGADAFGDSSLGLFYQPQTLKPGEKRVFSYSYGLGSLSSLKSGNANLSLVAPGPYVAGKPFWVTAAVNNPGAGRKVTLNLPPDLSFAEGHSAEKTASAAAGQKLAQVSWLVRPAATAIGDRELQATLSGIDKPETLKIEIKNPEMILVEPIISGTPTAGGRFRVTTAVRNPTADAKVRIELPEGLTLDGGEAETSVGGGKPTQVSWVVRVAPATSGPMKIDVRLSPGDQAFAKEVTIKLGEPKLFVRGPAQEITGGRVFTMAVQGVNCPPGMDVKLELPQGVQFADGSTENQTLKPRDSYQQAVWKVKADETTDREVIFRVKSADGRYEAEGRVKIVRGSLVQQ